MLDALRRAVDISVDRPLRTVSAARDITFAGRLHRCSSNQSATHRENGREMRRAERAAQCRDGKSCATRTGRGLGGGTNVSRESEGSAETSGITSGVGSAGGAGLPTEGDVTGW